MQETRNNCFRSKKRSTTLLQAKTGKHEFRNVVAEMHKYVAVTFRHSCSPEESCDVFSTRNNFCEFLASYGVTIQSVIQSFNFTYARDMLFLKNSTLYLYF